MRNAIVVTCQLTLNTSAAAVRNLGKLPGKGGGGGGGYEYEYDATYDDDMSTTATRRMNANTNLASTKCFASPT